MNEEIMILKNIARGLLRNMITGNSFKLKSKMFGLSIDIDENIDLMNLYPDYAKIINASFKIHITANETIVKKMRNYLRSFMLKDALYIDENIVSLLKYMSMEDFSSCEFSQFIKKYTNEFGGLTISIKNIQIEIFKIDFESGEFIFNGKFDDASIRDSERRIEEYCKKRYIDLL